MVDSFRQRLQVRSHLTDYGMFLMEIIYFTRRYTDVVNYSVLISSLITILLLEVMSIVVKRSRQLARSSYLNSIRL
ncbi:unnamed protein product [Amoebophrya sp. A25]|nr:unnamed protein product [Amoebophrya sp. A25]|eukprot:GSA25T00023962001.1